MAPSAKQTADGKAIKDGEPPKKDLTIESVGWLFIQKYYKTYTSDLGKLFGFYDKEASVFHEQFPEEAPESFEPAEKVALVARSSEGIRVLFEGQANQGKNKIVVESAAFQALVDGAIVIVVSGSWKRGLSPLWPFVQTFVLKAKSKAVYDLANDILKFVDVGRVSRTVEKVVTAKADTTEKETEETEAAQEEKKEEEKTEEAASTEQPASDAASNGTAEAAEAVAPQAAEPAEAAEPAKPAEPTEDGAEVAESAKPTEAPTPASSGSENTTDTEKTAVSTLRPTWATLAAIEPKNVTGKPATATSTPKPAPPAARKQSTTPTETAVFNGKYKKEEWYPIYIKNVDVEEDELRAALVRQFGDIKYFKKSNKTALCDFRRKEDQQKALEAKEMVLKVNTILLEPRIHKVANKMDPKKNAKPIKKNALKK